MKVASSWVSVLVVALACSLSARAGVPLPAKSPRISALAQAVKEGDGQAEQAFWEELERSGTPLMEPGDAPDTVRMTFVMRGRNGALGSNARLFIFRAESPFAPLQRVAGTDVWSLTWQVSSSARGMHLLSWPQGREPDPLAVWALPARDGVVYELFADPLSRLRYSGTLAPEFPDRTISAFAGAGAARESYLSARPGARGGRLMRASIPSAAFGTDRELSVYLPAGYAKQCRYSWLVMYDAEQFLSLMSIQTLLDNMIAQRAVAPLVAVLIHSGTSRLTDLPPNERSQKFLRDELIPWVRANYAVSERNRDVAIAGFSHGGLAAMNAALLNSDAIGNVIAQSGSFWWAPDLGPVDPAQPMPANANSLSVAFARAQRLPLRIYMDVGSWEGHFQVASNRQLHDVLLARDYPVTYAEYEGPHDYVAWRASFPNALLATLGAEAARDPCAAGHSALSR